MTSLPLFPLPVAVCPRELVPLHIFEERYKDMIRTCQDARLEGKPDEFIMSFFGPAGVSPVGTVVKLSQVIKTHENGSLDLIALGRRRCRIHEVTTDTSYRCAVPEAFEDERSDWDETLANEAYELHRALIQVIIGKAPEDANYAGVSQLSFLLASTISLSHETKQRLITLRSEDERLHLLIQEMSELMSHVERVQIAAREIQGNWELQKIYGNNATSR